METLNVTRIPYMLTILKRITVFIVVVELVTKCFEPIVLKRTNIKKCTNSGNEIIVGHTTRFKKARALYANATVKRTGQEL